MKVSRDLSTINRNQKYFRTRENRNFSTVKSTESRIFNFSVVESGLMVCMAGLQVFIVRFFFQGARKGEFGDILIWGWKVLLTSVCRVCMNNNGHGTLERGRSIVYGDNLQISKNLILNSKVSQQTRFWRCVFNPIRDVTVMGTYHLACQKLPGIQRLPDTFNQPFITRHTPTSLPLLYAQKGCSASILSSSHPCTASDLHNTS